MILGKTYRYVIDLCRVIFNVHCLEFKISHHKTLRLMRYSVINRTQFQIILWDIDILESHPLLTCYLISFVGVSCSFISTCIIKIVRALDIKLRSIKALSQKYIHWLDHFICRIFTCAIFLITEVIWLCSLNGQKSIRKMPRNRFYPFAHYDLALWLEDKASRLKMLSVIFEKNLS